MAASLGVQVNTTLAARDRSSAFDFDWANLRRDAVVGIRCVEAISDRLAKLG